MRRFHFKSHTSDRFHIKRYLKFLVSAIFSHAISFLTNHEILALALIVFKNSVWGKISAYNFCLNLRLLRTS